MKYLDLPSGRTAYDEINKDAPRTVLCLHGGTIPSWSFDAVFERLSKENIRAVRYDMFGRGESASPEGDYDRDFYLTQLTEFLDELGLDEIDTIVGSSFGGALTFNLLSKQPNRAKKMALISPAVNWRANNQATAVLRLPGLGKMIFSNFAKKKIRKRALEYIESLPEEFVAKYKTKIETQFSMDNEGFWRALFLQLRSNALASYYPECETIGALKQHKVGVIWGTEDTEVSKKDMEHLSNCFSDLIFEPVQDRTHGLIAEEPFKVAEFVFKMASL